MEFWGVEVKSGESLKVEPGEGMVLHLSQAGLGEIKDKVKESVCLRVKVDGKNLVLGTLSPEKLPQQLFDLVFDRDFELSHNWKNGSSDEDMLTLPADNGKPETVVAKQEKPPAAKKANEVKDTDAGKQKVKIVEPSKDAESEEDDDSEESDEFDDSDEDDMSDDLDESDEDTSKKRPTDSAAKTPVEKKAKLVTPQKTDGKKGAVHVATPHPAKQAGKTPANKSNQKSPKSEGPHSCKTCNKTFKSDGALDSHNKAKHTAGK
ncbi:hypothetical protein RJ639_005921 [Escallonia herrerae]|uniref:C2H2-type domain-containing protein n=1 Tax=Escallonia herrerae TaxID=1293975 RepID=A0AA89AY58_9ASTE|nr:hypothetical protein RJ639_005921 [Escallonia herrerae]